MKNIVLTTFYDQDSFAINTLHSVLKNSGFNVISIFFKKRNINNTMDPPNNEEIQILLNIIKENEPLFVGMSFRSTFFKLAVNITKEIKKISKAPIVWGGIHPIIRPQQCIEFADIICIGEGEESIVELANKLDSRETINNIHNLWIKNGNEIIKNELRPLIQDLDSIPFPIYFGENKYFIDGGKIFPLEPPSQRTDYCIMTSRGCPFKCTYCYNNIGQNIYKGKGKYVRRRSINNIIEELSQAKSRFINLAYISFLDDLFTFDINWIKEFCAQYKRHIALPFYCHVHPRFTNDEMIKALKDSGCVGITMGIQSGSEECRHKIFERYETNDEIIKAANVLHKYKVNCTYDLIMDNPLETEKHKRETFNLLLKLPTPFVLSIHSLTHFPETKLTKLLLSKGMISENEVEDQKEKSYARWTPTLDLERNANDLFWDNLYYLVQNKYIPRRLIEWLSNIEYLKRHPKNMTILLRFTSCSIFSIRSGSRMDLLRWYFLSFIFKPYLIFKKRTWFFLWSKLKRHIIQK